MNIDQKFSIKLLSHESWQAILRDITERRQNEELPHQQDRRAVVGQTWTEPRHLITKAFYARTNDYHHSKNADTLVSTNRSNYEVTIMTEQTPIQYRVNERNEIVFVNEAWQAFALANAGIGLQPANVLQRPLFDFITDETTRLLYRDLLKRVRAGHPVQFPFRCDAPAQRRWLDMTIRLTETGLVEFTTHLRRSEERSPISLLGHMPIRSATLLRMCSWCKRANLGCRQWVDLEEAVVRLRLFEQAPLPQLSHGICEICFASLQKQLLR